MSILDPSRVDKLIIHCADTFADMDIGAAEIRHWHMNPPPGSERAPWADIGYHFVIRRNGVIETGRHLNVMGAHAYPWNRRSIGICMVGGAKRDATAKRGKAPDNNFTDEQFAALIKLIPEVAAKFPLIKNNLADAVIGHGDVPGVNKACPSFDVKQWFKENF